MKVKKIENLVGIALDVPAKDFAKVARYAPEALKIVDEDGDEKFSVLASEGAFCGQVFGELKDYSAVFIKVGEKLIAWMGVPEDGMGDTKEWMLDEYGMALANLAKVEKQVMAAIKEADDKVQAIADTIDEVEL